MGVWEDVGEVLEDVFVDPQVDIAREAERRRQAEIDLREAEARAAAADRRMYQMIGLGALGGLALTVVLRAAQK